MFKLSMTKASASKNDMKLSKKTSSNCVIIDSLKSSVDFEIVLVDTKPAEYQKQKLKQMCDGIFESYIVLWAVDTEATAADMAGDGLTTFYINHRSNWRDYLDYEGRHCKGIVVFGAALYGISESSTIKTDDFIDDDLGLPSYFYLGHSWYPYDTNIYPVHYLNDVFAKPEGRNISGDNYKTRFCEIQMKRLAHDEFKKWQPDKRDPVLHRLSTKAEVDKVLNDNMGAELCAFDTETDGLTFYKLKVKCITVCWNGVDGYYLPFECTDLELLAKNFMSCKRLTGANPKFDLKVLWHQGLSQYVNVTDAQDLLAQFLHSGRKHGLKPSSYFYTCMGGYENKLRTFRKATGLSNFYNFPDEVLAPYAICDAIVTWRAQTAEDELCHAIDKYVPNEKFSDWPIWRWYTQRGMPIYRVVVKDEYDGIYINPDLQAKYRKELIDKYNAGIEDAIKGFMTAAEKKKEKRLEETDGHQWSEKAKKLPKDMHNIKITSTNDVGAWCYKYTDMRPYAGYISKHEPGTEMPALVMGYTAQMLWSNEQGIDAPLVLHDAKSCMTSVNAFLGSQKDDGSWSGWPQFESNHNIGTRIYQSYGVMDTSTFRFVSREPNFQNVPSVGIGASECKKCIDTPYEDLYTIETPDGKTYELAAFELVLTDKGYIEAQDLTEDVNIIYDDPERPVVKRLQFALDKGGRSSVPKDWNSWFVGEHKNA